VQVGRRHLPAGAAFPNGPNWGKDVFIPIDWVIGGEAMVGQGWRMLMECLAAGRAISLPSSATAGAIVPFYGQGANFGFEDCLVLDQCLSGHGGDWSAALRAYEQERRPNADAIAELSVAHLAELREKVGDPRFQLRKQIERKINRLYPERFAPLYSLISFSTLPYTTAWRIASEQSMLLDRILNVPDVERRWDGPEVEALIHELMRGMPPGVVLQGAVEWKPQAEPMPGRAR
jgi:hypothetical protein